MSEAHIYTGPDLASAASLSVPPAWARARAPRLRVPGVLNGLVMDLLSAPTIRLRPASVVVAGIERDSGAPMHIFFRGQLRAVDFCAQHILGTTEFERMPPSSSRPPEQCDVFVVDHPLVGRRPFGASAPLRVAQWVRQRCTLGDSWSATAANIPADLRKRIARLLRKGRYAVQLETDPGIKGDFFDSLYLPYARYRFGSGAIVASRHAFAREAADAALLQLRLDDRLIGASLVHLDGEALYMGKSGLTLDTRVGHVFDLLDYFCLLMAHLAGRRYLDFGVSRPHLEDGVFANKSKWRPHLLAAGGLKADIRIEPASRTCATAAFLARNGFIERRDGKFIVRRLQGEGELSPQDGMKMEELAIRSGLDAIILGVPAGVRDGGAGAPAFPGPGPRARLQCLAQPQDPIRSFLRHT